jgi:hypothetical protein
MLMTKTHKHNAYKCSFNLFLHLHVVSNLYNYSQIIYNCSKLRITKFYVNLTNFLQQWKTDFFNKK